MNLLSHSFLNSENPRPVKYESINNSWWVSVFEKTLLVCRNFICEELVGSRHEIYTFSSATEGSVKIPVWKSSCITDQAVKVSPVLRDKY